MANKIEVITSGNEHWYPAKKKDTFYPSVTTVLSVYPKGYGFDKYLANADSWESSQEILRKAGQRGTNVHKASELLELGNTLQQEFYTTEEWEMLIGYVNWRHQYPDKIVHSELPLISEKLKIGGTIDRVYRNLEDDQLFIIDIKTSSSIYENYWIQVAMYAEMYELKFKKEITYIGILRLTPRRKDGFEFKILDRSEWKEKIKVFSAVYAIWRNVNPKAAPRILELPTTLVL